MSTTVHPAIQHLYDERTMQFDEKKALKFIDDQVRHLEDLLESDFDVDKPDFQMFKMLDRLAGYTLVYKLCATPNRDNSGMMYNKHREIFERYLQNTVYPALKNLTGVELIQETNKRWKYHQLMNKWMYKVFYYIERYYCKQHNQPPLRAQGDEQFRTCVFNKIKHKLASAFHKQVMLDREGVDVDRFLLKECSELFFNMSNTDRDEYIEHLETGILRQLKDHAHSVADTWINEENASNYLQKTEQFFMDEVNRCQSYLQPSSETKLLSMLEDEFLKKKKDALLEKATGIKYMLEQDKTKDLARLFRLFRRIDNGLDSIAGAVRDFIQTRGMEIVRARENAAMTSKKKDTNSNVEFVTQLLSLLDEWKTKVTSTFEGHHIFQRALKDAFEVFVNTEVKCTHSNTELIASYCDQVLRGKANLKELQMEDELQRIVHLFTYILDKDIFSEIYRKQLAKRLLKGRSASKDAEKSMISKLKLRCGAQFTSKHEGMLSDLEQGSKQMEAFAKWRDEQFQLGKQGAFKGVPVIDFNVRVLTTGCWPNFPNISIKLPSIFERYQQAFEQFYYENSQNRKLTWQNTEGEVVLRGKFDRTYEITVNTIQAAALLFFEARGSRTIPFQEVCQHTKMDEETAKRVLHSLSCGQSTLLRKEPKGKTISTSDKFQLEEEFSSKLLKFRLPMATLEDSEQPKKQDEERRLAVDAAIVRIMKTRQTLQHQELVGQVLEQLKFFKPDAKFVKSRIEYCISNDYIERDDDDVNQYK